MSLGLAGVLQHFQAGRLWRRRLSVVLQTPQRIDAPLKLRTGDTMQISDTIGPVLKLSYEAGNHLRVTVLRVDDNISENSSARWLTIDEACQ